MQELNDVLGDENIPTQAQLSQLVYLQMALKETMRLRPAFPIFFRQADKDCVVGGYAVEAKSFVLPLIGKIHTDPKYWGNNPHLFNPDHFTPEAQASRPTYAYAPFGLGARKCIGERLGMMEATIIAGALLKRFHFARQPSTQVLPYVKFAWMTKYGIKMRPVRRVDKNGRSTPETLRHRKLGILENSIFQMNAIAPGAGNIVTTIDTSKALTKELIEQALPHVCCEHPLLAVTCEQRSDGLHFCPVEGAAFPVSVEQRDHNKTGEQQRDDIQHKLLNDDLFKSPWLFKIVLLNTPNTERSSATLFLSASHVICDGQTLMKLVKDLLRVINQLLNPSSTLPNPRKDSQLRITAPLETEMPYQQRTLRGLLGAVGVGFDVLKLQKIASRGRSFRMEANVPPAQRTSNNLTVSLDEQELSQLLRACKAQEATIHGALGTALLFAISAHLQDIRTAKELRPVDGKIGLPVVTTIDMRRRASPPLSPTTSGYLSSGIVSNPRVPLDVRDSDGTLNVAAFWDTSRHIAEENLKKIAEGEAWSALRVMEFLGPKGLTRQYRKSIDKPLYAPLYLANLGRIEPEAGAVAPLTNFSMHNAFHAFGAGIFALAMSINGRLNLSVTCPGPLMSKATLEGIVGGALDNLRSVANDVARQ